MRLKKTVTALGAKFMPDHIVLALTLIDSSEAVLGAQDPPHQPSASSTDAAPRPDPLALIDAAAAALETDLPHPDSAPFPVVVEDAVETRVAAPGAGRR